MNNEQNNNIFGGVNLTPPSIENNGNVNNVTPISTIINNSIPGATITPNSEFASMQNQPINPVTNSTPVMEQSQTIMTPTPIPTTTGEVVSQNNSVMLQNASLSGNSNISPELKIEKAIPFDIGISTSNSVATQSQQPVMTTENNSMPAVNENTNVSVMPTTPINNNIDNNISVSSKPINNDMNNVNTTSTNTSITNSTSISSSKDNIVSVGKYLGYIILFAIPIVGFIMLIVKGFVDKKDENISNFAKAYFIFPCIAVVISVVIALICITVFGSFVNTTTVTENTDSNWDITIDDD